MVSDEISKGLILQRYHACLGTGAQSTVIGLIQAQVYCRFTNETLTPAQNNHRYHFVKDKQASLVYIRIPVERTKEYVIQISVDVVNVRIIFLVELGFLCKYGFFVNNIKKLLFSETLDLQIPLTPQTWSHLPILET